MLINILGLIAAVTSVTGFLPQIIKNYQTRSVEDLSFLMLLNFVLCSGAWVAYGVLVGALAVWGTNILCLVASLLLCWQKVMYKNV